MLQSRSILQGNIIPSVLDFSLGTSYTCVILLSGFCLLFPELADIWDLFSFLAQ